MPKKRRKAKQNKSWKQAERRVAAFFGCMRTILSGASAHVRNSESKADTDHASIFIEIKQRQRHGVWAWWRKAYQDSLLEAKRSRSFKIPVLALDEIRAKGAIICIHSDHLEDFCNQFLASRRSRKRKSA